jgi:hypothetical protein
MPSSKNSFQTRLDKIVKSFVPPKQQNQDHSQVGGSTTDECDGGVDDDQYSSSSSPVPSFNIHRGLGQEEEEVDVINSEENLEEWPNMTVSDEKTKNVLNNSLQGVSNDDFQTGMNSDVSHPYTYRCDGSEPSESGTEKTSIDVMEKNTSSNRKAAESVEKREKGETLRSATKARVVPPIVTESQQKPSTSLFGRILAKLTPSKTSGPNDARNGEKNEPVEIGQELLIADEPLTKESSIPTVIFDINPYSFLI